MRYNQLPGSVKTRALLCKVSRFPQPNSETLCNITFKDLTKALEIHFNRLNKRALIKLKSYLFFLWLPSQYQDQPVFDFYLQCRYPHSQGVPDAIVESSMKIQFYISHMHTKLKETLASKNWSCYQLDPVSLQWDSFTQDLTINALIRKEYITSLPISRRKRNTAPKNAEGTTTTTTTTTATATTSCETSRSFPKHSNDSDAADADDEGAESEADELRHGPRVAKKVKLSAATSPAVERMKVETADHGSSDALELQIQIELVPESLPDLLTCTSVLDPVEPAARIIPPTFSDFPRAIKMEEEEPRDVQEQVSIQPQPQPQSQPQLEEPEQDRRYPICNSASAPASETQTQTHTQTQAQTQTQTQVEVQHDAATKANQEAPKIPSTDQSEPKVNKPLNFKFPVKPNMSLNTSTDSTTSSLTNRDVFTPIPTNRMLAMPMMPMMPMLQSLAEFPYGLPMSYYEPRALLQTPITPISPSSFEEALRQCLAEFECINLGNGVRKLYQDNLVHDEKMVEEKEEEKKKKTKKISHEKSVPLLKVEDTVTQAINATNATIAAPLGDHAHTHDHVCDHRGSRDSRDSDDSDSVSKKKELDDRILLQQAEIASQEKIFEEGQKKLAILKQQNEEVAKELEVQTQRSRQLASERQMEIEDRIAEKSLEAKLLTELQTELEQCKKQHADMRAEIEQCKKQHADMCTELDRRKNHISSSKEALSRVQDLGFVSESTVQLLNGIVVYEENCHKALEMLKNQHPDLV